MRRPIMSQVVRTATISIVAFTTLAHFAALAQAQSRFYFGPNGFGYSYEDDDVGVHIGQTPYDRREAYRNEYRYYEQDYYYEEADDDYYEEPELPRAVIDAEGEAAEYQAMAEEAFRAGDYRSAARWSRHAAVEEPRNGALHLFAGQIYFATGDYACSAAAVHQGMSLAERDDWGLVAKNYTKFYQGNDYVSQMNALIAFIKKNPSAPYAYFLRGYHYGFLGHEKAARSDFAKALELESRDQLAGELLTMMGGQLPAKAATAAPNPTGGN